MGGILAVLVLVVLAASSLATSAAAHNNGYAFEARDVRIKQNNLRFVFNRMFPDWGPHQVRCRGQGPTTMRGGGKGYVHIRCSILTMNVPDYIWHIDSRGEDFTTRSWG